MLLKQSKEMTTFAISGLNICYISKNNDMENTKCTCELCKKTLLHGKIVVGKCHHAFHDECMKKLGSFNNSSTHQQIALQYISCPIDNTAWTTEYAMDN